MDLYPRAKVRLVIRLDELGGALGDAPPAVQALNVTGSASFRRDPPLKVVPDPEQPGRLVLVEDMGSPGQGDLTAQRASQDGLTHAVEGIVPRKATRKQNGVRRADELELDVRWSDFPFDPRCVRAIGVQYYLGTVSPEEHAATARGLPASAAAGAAGPGGPMAALPDSYVDANGSAQSNERFRGVAVEWETALGEEGEQLVRLSCRDLTVVLMGIKMPPKAGIDPKLPIDQGVAKLLTRFPQVAGMSVEFRPPAGATGDAATAPKPSSALQRGAQVPGVGVPQARTGGAEGGQALWDYVVDTARATGLSARLEGARIVLEEVRSWIDQTRLDDPYYLREVNGELFPVRAMVYGRNVLSLSVRRSLPRAPENYALRSYDPLTKRTLEAKWPRAGNRQASPLPGDGRTDEKYTVVLVPDGVTQGTLETMARNYYESRHRQELRVHVKTRDLASFGGGNADPDLLAARPGDAVEVLSMRGRGTSGTTADVQEKIRASAQFLEAQGYDAAFSTRYAELASSAQLTSVFVLAESVETWDVETGVDYEMDLVNYVVVRADTEGQPSKARAPAAVPGLAPAAVQVTPPRP